MRFEEPGLVGGRLGVFEVDVLHKIFTWPLPSSQGLHASVLGNRHANWDSSNANSLLNGACAPMEPQNAQTGKKVGPFRKDRPNEPFFRLNGACPFED
jgi:hypothetical protein